MDTELCTLLEGVLTAFLIIIGIGTLQNVIATLKRVFFKKGEADAYDYSNELP